METQTHMTPKEKARMIKKALASLFKDRGYKISVTTGRGTAYGWIRVYIDTQAEHKDTNFMINNDDDILRLERNRWKNMKFRNEIHNEAQDEAYRVMNEANQKFYTYTSDDGYNTEDSRFSIQVN